MWAGHAGWAWSPRILMCSAGSTTTCWGWPNWLPARAGSSSISAMRVCLSSSSAAASLSTTGPATRLGMRSLTLNPRDQLVSRGVQQVTEIEGDAQAGGRWCYFRDAEGNIFEIKERHEQGTQ